MGVYDDRLRELLAQCARKKKLEAAASELRKQRETYAVRARELERMFRDEQEDVDRLEGRSLSAFFYRVTGRMEEKLAAEKQEAYAARVKYDAVARELSGIKEDLHRCTEELDSLRGCEERYAAVLQEKTRAVKAAGGSTAEKILRLEEQLTRLSSREREAEEAFAAGQAALGIVDRMEDDLGSAEDWGTWDLAGGGVISGLAKYSHLDKVQACVEELQSQLRRFKTELADVLVDADIQLGTDGFLRAADYIFDGIFVDWTVLNRIHRTQEQLQCTRDQICSVQDRLRAQMERTRMETEETQREIAELVGRVPL